MSHMHPEFGYFCPTPRLRRDLRMALLALAFGGTLGSVTVAALSTDRNAQPASGSRMEYAEMPGMDKRSAAIRSDYQVEIGFSVNLARSDLLQKALQGWALDISAGEAAVVIFAPEQDPAGMGLAPDIGL
jgi:hypothetical protein